MPASMAAEFSSLSTPYCQVITEALAAGFGAGELGAAAIEYRVLGEWEAA